MIIRREEQARAYRPLNSDAFYANSDRRSDRAVGKGACNKQSEHVRDENSSRRSPMSINVLSRGVLVNLNRRSLICYQLHYHRAPCFPYQMTYQSERAGWGTANDYK